MSEDKNKDVYEPSRILALINMVLEIVWFWGHTIFSILSVFFCVWVTFAVFTYPVHIAIWWGCMAEFINEKSCFGDNSNGFLYLWYDYIFIIPKIVTVIIGPYVGTWLYWSERGDKAKRAFLKYPPLV